MKARTYLATLLSAAMLLSLLSTGALAEENHDLAPSQTTTASTLPQDATDSWAADSIARWTESGVVKGNGAGNFNPEANLTRGELAQTFVNMLGLTEKAENTFSDLKSTDWYADAVLKCAAAGLMQGDGKRINGESNITRQETIVMFGRAVGVAPDSEPDLSQFTDADSVASWAAGYMAPLAEMGILSGGGDGSLNAAGNIDRASTMALLDKSVAEYVNAPGEYHVDNAKGFVIVNVAAKEGEVVLSGTTAGVAVSAGTAEGKIVAKDLKAATIKVDGAAAVSVEGKSSVGEVVANAAGEITVAKSVTVDTITANGTGTVDNAGTVKSMVSNGTGTVTNSGTVESLVANSTGTVANSGTVNSLVANSTGAVSNTGTVKELVANAPATIDNKGTVTNADIKVDGVVIDGKKPAQTVVPEGVQPPTDSAGKELPSVKPEDAKPADQIPAPKPERPNVPSGPSRADIVVTAQGLGVTGDPSDGAVVSFSLSGTQLSRVSNVAVALYCDNELLATNTSEEIDLFKTEGERATLFIVTPKEFDAEGDRMWTYGDFVPSVYKAPTKAVITVTDVNDYTYTATSEGLLGEWESLFGLVTTKEELTAALGNETVSLITLSANIDATEVLTVDRAVTLDLNGKTLSSTYEGSAPYGAVAVTAGVLTVKDSATEGKLTAAGANGNTVLVGDAAEFILESGTVENTTEGRNVLRSQCGDITINGGTVYTENGYGIVIFGTTQRTITVNDGTITAGLIAISSMGTKSSCDNYTININGGTIQNTGDSTDNSAIYLPGTNGVTNISGGDIIGTGTAVAIRTGELNITGGTLTSTAVRNDEGLLVNGQSGSVTGVIVVGKPATTSATGYVGDIAVTIGEDAILGNESVDAIVIDARNNPRGDTVSVTGGAGKVIITGTSTYTPYEGDFVMDATTAFVATVEELKAAIANESISTVTLLTNISLGDEFTEVTLAGTKYKGQLLIPAERNLTIDLNGKTISTGVDSGNYMIINQGDLTIDGTTENSTITANEGYAEIPNAKHTRGLMNYQGSLTLQGGTYMANYAVTNNLDNPLCNGDGTVTINGAILDAGFCGFANFKNGKATITDTEITATYYALSNNGLYGGTEFDIHNSTLTSTDDTAVFFPAGDLLSLTDVTVNAPLSSGIEVYAGAVKLLGSTVINAGGEYKATIPADGSGSKMDGSALLMGYRAGYKTGNNALSVDMEESVRLNSVYGNSIRIVALGTYAAENGAATIELNYYADNLETHGVEIDAIRRDVDGYSGTLTVNNRSEDVSASLPDENLQEHDSVDMETTEEEIFDITQE